MWSHFIDFLWNIEKAWSSYRPLPEAWKMDVRRAEGGTNSLLAHDMSKCLKIARLIFLRPSPWTPYLNLQLNHGKLKKNEFSWIFTFFTPRSRKIHQFLPKLAWVEHMTHCYGWKCEIGKCLAHLAKIGISMLKKWWIFMFFCIWL